MSDEYDDYGELVDRVTKIIYEEIEGPVNNQDGFVVEMHQWNRSNKIAVKILNLLDIVDE